MTPVADAIKDPNKLTQGVRPYAGELYQSTSALINAFSGLGTSRDPSFFNDWSIPRPLGRGRHFGMGRNALIAQALGKLGNTATREGWRVVITDDRVDDPEACADKIAAYESRLGISTAMARAIFRGRQYGEAMVMLGIADGCPLSAPVDWAAVKTIRWAAVIDCRDYQPHDMYPASSEHFGKVERFRITDINGVLEDGLRYGGDAVAYQYDALQDDFAQQIGQVLILADRILHFPTADYSSVLDSLQDSLGGYFTSMSGIATAARESSTVVYKITDWIRKAWSEDANLAHAHMSFVDKAKSTINAWIIDKDKEEVEIKNRTLSGVADLSNPFMVWLSASLGEPVTEFWGVSPGGFGKGEAEKATSHQNVRAFQRAALTPPLTHLHGLILVAEDGCQLPRDIQRTIDYADLSPPDEEVRSKLRSEALDDLTKAFEAGGITRDEYRAGVVELADDYFRFVRTQEGERVTKDAPVGVFTGSLEILLAAARGEIPTASARLLLPQLAPSSFSLATASEIIAPIDAARAAPPSTPTGGTGGALPGDEEDAAAPDEPSEIDLAWSQNPLPSDAMEAPAIAEQLGLTSRQSGRITRAHKAGLIEGWNVLGGKPRYSLAEVRRVILQGNGKLASDRDAKDDVATVCVVLRAPKDVAQWVPYKADEPSAPHVTLLYVGKVEPWRVFPILDAVRRVVVETPALQVDLAGVDYFDNERRVAFARVQPTDALALTHVRLRDAIAETGVEVQARPDYTPHLTLAYLPPGEDYTGPVPPHGWTAHEIEFWYDDLALPIKCAKQLIDPPADTSPDSPAD